MKIALLSLFLFPMLAGAQETPKTSPRARMQVTQVTCQSGAPVNFAATARPGTVFETASEFASLRRDDRVVLKHRIRAADWPKDDGPCPGGDIELFEFQNLDSQD